MTGLWAWCLLKHRLGRKCDMFLGGEITKRARLSRPYNERGIPRNSGESAMRTAPQSDICE